MLVVVDAMSIPCKLIESPILSPDILIPTDELRALILRLGDPTMLIDIFPEVPAKIYAS